MYKATLTEVAMTTQQRYTMEDVRSLLWKAYKIKQETKYGVEGKISEAYCELVFPTFWECETENEFLKPSGLMIYSYALGPSRRHYINSGQEDREINYYTWESPDIYRKAVEVIESWIYQLKEEMRNESC